MYTALREIYTKTRETIAVDGRNLPVYAVSWKVLGTCMTYAEARARFGGRPVLEEIREK